MREKIQTLAFVAWVVVAGSAGRPTASPQAPVSDRLAFEVASIKRAEVAGSMIAPQPGGRLVVKGVPLRAIVTWAYGLQNFQLEGGPGWMSSDGFDIDARAPEAASSQSVSPADLQRRMQSLLAERFKLALHTETRQRQVYALVVARGDKRLGPQLEVTNIDCSADARSGAITRRRTASGGTAFACGIRAANGTLEGGNMTMADLAKWLSSATGEMVVDQTTLAGRWNVDLAWTPLPRASASAAASATASDQDRPSLFTAIEEQLGLKLRPTRAPVEIFVVDHVEEPSLD